MCENCNSKTWNGKYSGSKILDRCEVCGFGEEAHRRWDKGGAWGDIKPCGGINNFQPVNVLPAQKEAEERAKRQTSKLVVDASDIVKGEVGFDKFGNMYFCRNGVWEFRGNFYNDGALLKNLLT